MDKLAPRFRLEPHLKLVPLSLAQSLENPPHLVQKLGRVAELDIASYLRRRPLENHPVRRRTVIIILENIILIDKGNLHGQMVQNQIGLRHRQIAMTKKAVVSPD